MDESLGIDTRLTAASESDAAAAPTPLAPPPLARPGTAEGRDGGAGRRKRGRPLLLWLLVAAAAAAVLVTAGLAVVLPRIDAPTSSVPAAPAGPVLRPALQGEVQAALDRAAAALQARDRAAYRAALPSSGRPARRALNQLYAKLAQLPWSRFAFSIQPIPGHPGRYDVYAAGQLGRVGPADRVAGERVLEFERVGRRVIATGDVTPPALRHRFLMAFNDAVAVQRGAGIIIADRSWRPLALKLGGDFATARNLIAVTGIKPGAPLAVYLYSTAGELRAAIGGRASETRIRFFSVNVDRMATDVWRTRDVGVLGPELAGLDAWRPRMLAHEMTHASTMGWFKDTAHAPALLVEGLATMVEGGRSYAPLRQELAAGSPHLPLTTAIAMGSLWMGNATDRVHLGYLEGGSLVGYVLDRWGFARLKRWLVTVADSDLTRDGLDTATRDTLRVSWARLEAGWRGYVAGLP